MPAPKSDHTPAPRASAPPSWRRALEDRVLAVLCAHDGMPSDPWEQREEAANRKRTVQQVVDIFVDTTNAADAILADMMSKVVELSRRPTLADVLGTLELAAAKAPTLTEGNALREVAARFRRVYGGGR